MILIVYILINILEESGRQSAFCPIPPVVYPVSQKKKNQLNPITRSIVIGMVLKDVINKSKCQF